ncbi:hypothetical protein E5S67_06432 [Microcoleus sp. IPMA8]|uniref:Uncharacterized protein n=1 Tax=Microcoleus asticus IPMA8 TaxID=2563858 RepID=A0ABX2D7L4_9CYAN|nr:hypothetical protein [Microcoleus asticus IPMA8]
MVAIPPLDVALRDEQAAIFADKYPLGGNTLQPIEFVALQRFLVFQLSLLEFLLLKVAYQDVSGLEPIDPVL